jgi:DNA-binding Lrp family transcriptional regulator
MKNFSIMSNIKERVEAQYFIKNLSGKNKFIISKKSREIGLSRQTYQNKLNSLREQKTITNYTININPNLHPSNMKFIFLEIKTNPKETQLSKNLLIIPQLEMLDGIFGEFSLIALLSFKSNEEYYEVLNQIDKIMSQSYFKKYQIIETIKVFKINGIELNNKIINPKHVIDTIDNLILEILENEQGVKPISTYEIRDIILERYTNILNKLDKDDISQSTIHNRIKRLEKIGVILNYTVKFCPKKVGFKGKYILRIKPKDPSKYNELALGLESKNEITDLFRIGEEYGLLAIVRVKKVEDYSNFIRNLYLNEEIEDTFTNFVLDELNPYTNFKIY